MYHRKVLPKLARNFFNLLQKKLDEADFKNCWIFPWGTHSYGYGQLTVNGKKWAVHRLVYFLCIGNIPKALCVCHHCDNPACFNPIHLFLGSLSENIKDRDRKGRCAKGEIHYRTHLTVEDVQVIRARAEKGEFQREIAKDYGIVRDAVGRIVRRKNWKHID